MEETVKTNIHTIRYMGNKTKMLEDINALIISMVPKGSLICDIMAGTNSVGMSLKNDFKIVTNDVEYYSYVLSRALISNNYLNDLDQLALEFDKIYSNISSQNQYTYFSQNYTDKFFSYEQSVEIDDIRYAIDKIGKQKYVLLTSLMYAINVAQSSPGHFAAFLDKNTKRVQSLRKISIYNKFREKLIELIKYVKLFDENNNQSFNMDFKEFLETEISDKIDLYYVDPPYSGEQYSRFYHLLNTLCKYDNPNIKFKAGYRDDRFMSNFSYRSKVKREFEILISGIKKKNSKLVISYSNRGLMNIEEIIDIVKAHYELVDSISIDYKHSTMGKGNSKLTEYLIYTGDK